MADDEQSSSEATALPSFHSSGNVPSDIEGDIHIAVNDDSEDEFNTLDEPVSNTLVSKTSLFILNHFSLISCACKIFCCIERF